MATGAEFAAVAQELPDKHIPYAKNGASLSAMDCQGLMEYCLRQVGISKTWKGSNAMYRDMAWIGTPEECKKTFGRIPIGAWLYIWDNNGGEVARGYKDGLGNASHVGVYTGEGLGAVHASQSRGKVAESKFAGKTIPNGGWNRVGLCRLLDYGMVIPSAKPEQTTAFQPGEAAAPSAEGKPLIKRGSRGEAVIQLQKILSAIGYDLEIDGIFGVMTKEAVKTYQATHGLTADGIVGPMTWAELL